MEKIPSTLPEDADSKTETEKKVEYQFSWYKAKDTLASFFKGRLSPAEGEVFYNLAHTGRGMDDFPMNITLMATKNESGEHEISASDLFAVIAENIETYIFKKVSAMKMSEEVRQIVVAHFKSLTGVSTTGSDFATDDETYPFLESLKTEYRDSDREKFMSVLRNDELLSKLSEVAFAVQILKLRLKLGVFDTLVIDLEELQQLYGNQWIKNINLKN